MSRIFRLSIDHETLTDELFAFVMDPRSTRYQRRVACYQCVLHAGNVADRAAQLHEADRVEVRPAAGLNVRAHGRLLWAGG